MSSDYRTVLTVGLRKMIVAVSSATITTICIFVCGLLILGGQYFEMGVGASFAVTVLTVALCAGMAGLVMLVFSGVVPLGRLRGKIRYGLLGSLVSLIVILFDEWRPIGRPLDAVLTKPGSILFSVAVACVITAALAFAPFGVKSRCTGPPTSQAHS
jgi:hypothetical protein